MKQSLSGHICWCNDYMKGGINTEFLSQYIVLIIVAICLCLGYVIKHSISFLPNKYIPFIMAIAGIFLNIWINGWKFNPEILLGGMISGLASTGTHELYKNLVWKKEPGDKKLIGAGFLKGKN